MNVNVQPQAAPGPVPKVPVNESTKAAQETTFLSPRFYTTDFDATPVVRNRLHWVLAEAMATAWTLHQVTGEQEYAQWFQEWAAHAEHFFVDRESGSWHPELDEHNRPADTVWEGKPDVYHAYQATLLPRLAPAASFIGALA